MRRALPPVLVFLGTMLIVLGALAFFWIGPAVRQAPIDLQSRTTVVGEGSYFDFAEGEVVETDQLVSVTNTQSDQTVYEGEDPISDDVAVYDQTGALLDEATGYEISFSEARYAIDRVSAEPIDCCGAPSEIEGLTIKWPFGTDQVDYPLWDGTLGAAATATFVGEDEVEGLPVYLFEVETPATDVGPASEDAEFPRVMYEASKSYAVEPQTGRIVDVSQDVHQWVVDEEGETVIEAVDVSLAMTDEDVADNVVQGKDDTGLLRLLDLSVWLAPLIGLALLVAGVVLFRPDRGGDRPRHGVKHQSSAGAAS